jgi:hypothetical protein
MNIFHLFSNKYYIVYTSSCVIDGQREKSLIKANANMKHGKIRGKKKLSVNNLLKINKVETT